MRIVHVLGAGALGALMAADRAVSKPAPGKSRRAALGPSGAAMGETPFQEAKNAASCAASASGSRVWHSHITSADQPARASAPIASASR